MWRRDVLPVEVTMTEDNEKLVSIMAGEKTALGKLVAFCLEPAPVYNLSAICTNGRTTDTHRDIHEDIWRLPGGVIDPSPSTNV